MARSFAVSLKHNQTLFTIPIASERLVRPAHIAEWLMHSADSRASHAQWPEFTPQPRHVHLPKNY